MENVVSVRASIRRTGLICQCELLISVSCFSGKANPISIHKVSAGEGSDHDITGVGINHADTPNLNLNLNLNLKNLAVVRFRRPVQLLEPDKF